jgi:beta-glucosidase
LEKFRLGLVDQRYVDVDAAAAVVGRADFVEAGLDAQRASYTLLTNNDDVLPLNAGLTVYVEGVGRGGFEAHFHAGSSNAPSRKCTDCRLSSAPCRRSSISTWTVRPSCQKSQRVRRRCWSPTAAAPAHLQTWCLGWPGRKARLPFDLPSSTRSVEDSRSDVPCRSTLPDPLFRFGHDQVPRLAPI